MELLPLIAFILAWYFVAKFYKKKGTGAVIRHLAGFAVGFLSSVLTVLIVIPKPEAPPASANETKQEQVIQETKPEQSSTSELETEKELAQAQETETEKPDVKPEREQTLELDVKAFSARISKALKNAQSPFKMAKNPKIQDGEVNDVVNYMFTERFGVIITLEKKTHKVKSIMTLVTPSPENSDENLVMLFSSAAVLSAFEGENEIKILGKKIMELTMSAMTEYGETKKDVSKDIIWNGKKYGVSISQYTGIISYAGFAD